MRVTRGVVLLLVPLLALMPLLHAHPPGSVDGNHPSGVHLPATNAAAAAPGRGSTAAVQAWPFVSQAVAPATIVVQDLRHCAARSSLPASGTTFTKALRVPVVVIAARRTGQRRDITRPAPLLHAHRPQAPPPGAAAA